MKFSIVTPTSDSGHFLSETIQSVLSQKGDFTIEYIVADNCSQDNTAEIVKSYQRMIEDKEYRIQCNGIEIKLYQGKDSGMYDAINKGFAKATGDIYAWINSDDRYLPGAFGIVARSFETYPEIKWLKGITSYINEFSALYETGQCYLYDQNWLRNGVYGREAYFVQQDSVFWRADLWKTVGGIDTRFKRAGDYSLWVNFSQHAPLYSLKAYVSCFRKVKGQLSQDVALYEKECDMISGTGKFNFFTRDKIRIFFWLVDNIHLPFFWKLIYRIIFRKQKLLLLDVINGEKPALKTASYYVAN